MEQFFDFSGNGGYEQNPEPSVEQNVNAARLQDYQQPPAAYNQDLAKPTYMHPSLPPQISCDVKPRLNKEQHDLLESEFQKQHKPSTNAKKVFADRLGVSLDKINNWFQNRRAKSKQDLKKQQGAINLYAQQGNSSDPEPSPSYPAASSEYARMNDQWLAEQQQLNNGLRISDGPQFQEQMSYHDVSPQNGFFTSGHYQQFAMPPHAQQDGFETQLEQNRRTLTQENFNAMARSGGLVDGSGNFEDFHSVFAGDSEVLNQVFPELQDEFKSQDAFAFPHPAGAPLSSEDSTIPSNVSEQSFHPFPTTSSMQAQNGMSAHSSDWGDSRSSSLYEGGYMEMAAAQQDLATASTSQWQQGDSKPVDFALMDEEFKQASQGRVSNQQQEQPLAWPDDDAFTRRDSQASLLAQSLGNVGIQTPHPQQSATFKSPPPPSSIAARRQRPRPAALSLRSQSYSAQGQPGSPGHVQQQQPSGLNASLPLRRIRSSQVIGSLPQGRVMKSVPGSAQRSPLNFTFNDALNSPHATRHASLQSQSLAPPTPMSPGEFSRAEQARQMSLQQTASAQVSRHPSINENDLEHSLSNTFPYQSTGAMPVQNFTSPPHTPQHFQQQFVPQRIAPSGFAENTPPQSAPASQTCFPSNPFAVPQQQVQPIPQQSLQPIAMAHAQMAMNTAVPERQFQGPNVTFMPAQQAHIAPAGPPAGMPYQFANGMPVVNAAGDLQMAFPSNMQFVHQQHSQGQPQHMHASSQVTHPFISSTAGPSDAQPNAQSSKPATEYFFHEYTPPEAVKRAATPRKPVDTGPKEYHFSHSRAEDFEGGKNKKKSEKAASIASNSPNNSS